MWPRLLWPPPLRTRKIWVAGMRRAKAALCSGGLWTNWTSVRKAKEGEVTADIYAFLTIGAKRRGEARASKGDARHSDDGRGARHLDAPPWDEAKALQRPLPDGSLKIIATGEKEDPALAA